MRLWNVIVLANDAADYALAIALLIAVPFFLALAKRLASRLLVNGASAAMARATNLWLLLPLAVYAATLPLELPPRLERIAALAALVAMLAQGGIWASRALAAWFERRFRDVRAQDPDGATTLRLIGFAAQGALWLLVGLLALDQLGFDVTALVAGLGIGGVALALAVQNILGDVFACAAIALDKPFVVGDFIVVDGLRGTVENVGLKTTRVRSLDGELLVFSNADLLKSRVRNFKRMFERRIQFSIAVNYDTPADKLRRIPGWLREAGLRLRALQELRRLGARLRGGLLRPRCGLQPVHGRAAEPEPSDLRAFLRRGRRIRIPDAHAFRPRGSGKRGASGA